jgi:hypothetical protein
MVGINGLCKRRGADWSLRKKTLEKTVDTRFLVSYFSRSVIGQEQMKRREPLRLLKKSGGSWVFVVSSGQSGDSPVSAHVAQLVEHVLGKDEVIGSNPIMGSRP